MSFGIDSIVEGAVTFNVNCAVGARKAGQLCPVILRMAVFRIWEEYSSTGWPHPCQSVNQMLQKTGWDGPIHADTLKQTHPKCSSLRLVPSFFCVLQERNEVMQKQLEGLSFLDKRKATKPKLVADQVPSASVVPPDAGQVIVPVQQQTSVVSPSKVPPAKSTKRVAPVPRRARARGALLQDTEENGDDE